MIIPLLFLGEAMHVHTYNVNCYSHEITQQGIARFHGRNKTYNIWKNAIQAIQKFTINHCLSVVPTFTEVDIYVVLVESTSSRRTSFW